MKTHFYTTSKGRKVFKMQFLGLLYKYYQGVVRASKDSSAQVLNPVVRKKHPIGGLFELFCPPPPSHLEENRTKAVGWLTV